MEQSVPKLFKQMVLAVTTLLLSVTLFAQTTPELVFHNPVLESGTDGQDGAQYRFSNITDGIDGLLTIKGRSSSAVVLLNIDLPNLGWDKALQPQLGISGNVPAYQNWWMQFDLQFVKSGTTKKTKLKDFVVTALDIDGDNVSIREYLQMNKTSSLAFSPQTQLTTGTAIDSSLLNQIDTSSNASYNLAGNNNMILGPVQNFTDIDTSATAVMATFGYTNKDDITFIYGGTSNSAVSNAGIRLNSLWFKRFSLAPQLSTLPVKLETFSAVYNNSAVTLNWKTASEKDFSHFVLQRSVDGKSYSDIALVFAAGGNSENEYSYKDKTAALATGVAYYRLRMVDENGSASYSYVSAVHLKDAANNVITAYPNPAVSNVQVSLPAAWQGKTVRLKLVNGNGIAAIDKEVKGTGATAALAVGQLPSGFYIIQASCNGETAQQRMLKN